MERDEALAQAKASARARGIAETEDLRWRVFRFSDGWLCNLVPRVPFTTTGAHRFIVMDTGEVHLETGSQDVSTFLRRYSSVAEPVIEYEDGRVTILSDGTTRFTPNDG